MNALRSPYCTQPTARNRYPRSVGITDPDIGGSLTERRLDITMTVEADDVLDATAKSLSAARTAIHAAGGSTPGWQRCISGIAAQARALVDA